MTPMIIAIAVITVATVFVVGQVMSMRPSAEERALGLLRERARKLNLNPRLINYPDWLSSALTPTSQQPTHGMIAYYSVILQDAQMPLMHALIKQQHLHVVQGDRALEGHLLDVKGAIAIEIQSNHVGLYWDEMQDLSGDHLESMPAQLTALANIPPKSNV